MRSRDPANPSRLSVGGVLVALVGLVVLGATLRITYTTGSPLFDSHDSSGFLTTDPAHIAYVTNRIAAAGGGVPDDFRADPRLEYPEASDIPAMFTVGQEFVVAWASLLVGDAVSLHVLAVWLMSVFAALTAVGVWGIGRELTGSSLWGLGAAALWTALPTSYRTLGFVFVREDFSFPIYTLHLWSVLVAARTMTPGAFLLAGATAVCAAATWHMVGSFLLVEVGCVALWFVLRRENALAPRHAWWTLVPVAAGAVVPVLAAKGWLLSLPVAAVVGLVAAGVCARIGMAWWRGVVVFAAVAGGLSASSLVVGAGRDYGHVFELIWDKVRYLGVRPADPSQLSFGTRLLWQGPFETSPLGVFVYWLGLPILALLVGLALQGHALARGRSDSRHCVWLVFTGVACVVTWLVSRCSILAGVTLSAATVLVLHNLRRVTWAGVLLLLLAVGVQGWQSRAVFALPPWWGREGIRPAPARVEARRQLVSWVRGNVPLGEPVLADFLTGTGLLYHTGHPILLQPKYETARSRARIAEFFTVLFGGAPEELRSWMAERQCRWLVLDWHFVGGNQHLAGPARADTTPAASWFFSPKYRDVPGFELRNVVAGPDRRPRFTVYRAR